MYTNVRCWPNTSLSEHGPDFPGCSSFGNLLQCLCTHPTTALSWQGWRRWKLSSWAFIQICLRASGLNASNAKENNNTRIDKTIGFFFSQEFHGFHERCSDMFRNITSGRRWIYGILWAEGWTYSLQGRWLELERGTCCRARAVFTVVSLYASTHPSIDQSIDP